MLFCEFLLFLLAELQLKWEVNWLVSCFAELHLASAVVDLVIVVNFDHRKHAVFHVKVDCFCTKSLTKRESFQVAALIRLFCSLAAQELRNCWEF